jgi:hypothetical protein
VLSGLLYLAALLAWVRFDEEEPGSEPRRSTWTRSILLYVLALLSKTVTATLPAAMLVFAWWRRGRITRRDVVPTLPFFALGAAAGFLTSWMERFHVGASGGDWSLSFLDRFLVAGRAFWFYLGKLVGPHPLMFVYPRWKVETWDASAWLWPLSAALVLLALWLLRDRIGRGPLAAMLFFGVTLGPALGFVNVYPMRFSYVADHFQYLASLGPIALAAALLARIDRRVLLGLVPALLLALSAVTWRQERAYRTRRRCGAGRSPPIRASSSHRTTSAASSWSEAVSTRRRRTSCARSTSSRRTPRGTTTSASSSIGAGRSTRRSSATARRCASTRATRTPTTTSASASRSRDASTRRSPRSRRRSA